VTPVPAFMGMNTDTHRHRHLFGPVPSRRLGWSLGVDLTPPKTCTLDCVFCQLGRTTARTTERAEYVPVADVLAEVADRLSCGGTADTITLAGAGEPALHSRFGEVIDSIRRLAALAREMRPDGVHLNTCVRPPAEDFAEMLT